MRSTHALVDPKLFDSIYAVASPGSALEPMLETLADSVGAGSTLLAFEDKVGSTNKALWARTDTYHQGLYVDHVLATRPLASVSASVPVGMPYLADDADQNGAIRRARALRDWCALLGIRAIMGAHLVRSGTRLGLLGFSSSRPFGQANIARYGMLLPHIRRALDLRRQLEISESWRSCAEAAFDVIRFPFLLTDGLSRIVSANRLAERWLAEKAFGTDGSDRIIHMDLATTRDLRRHISAAVQAGTRAILQLPFPSEDRSCVLVAPATFPSVKPGLAMLLLSSPGSAGRADPEMLRTVFGLTRAEASLALEIQSGQGVIAAAANLGVTVATARTHLHRTFEKTGTRRQSELVRLLDTLPCAGPLRSRTIRCCDPA